MGLISLLLVAITERIEGVGRSGLMSREGRKISREVFEKIREICRELEFPAELLPKPILEPAAALIEAGKVEEARKIIAYYVKVLRKVEERMRIYEEEYYEMPTGATGFVLYPPVPPTPPGD